MLAFLTIACLHLLAVISPGPDFALILKNTVSYSKRAGIFSAAGLATSVLIHCSYCILGLAVIIANSIVLFTIIKFIGAAYLIYIGIKALFATKSLTVDGPLSSQQQLSDKAAFVHGLLCNLLNPKASLFFLGIFTLVVKPDTSILIQVLYSLEMGIMTFIWFSFVATVVGHDRVKRRLSRLQHVVNKMLGGFLLIFGFKLILLTR